MQNPPDNAPSKEDVEEENEAMQQYGSSDSGASLGDILGAALREREQQSAESDPSLDEIVDNGSEKSIDSEEQSDSDEKKAE